MGGPIKWNLYSAVAASERRRLENERRARTGSSRRRRLPARPRHHFYDAAAGLCVCVVKTSSYAHACAHVGSDQRAGIFVFILCDLRVVHNTCIH